MDDRTKVTTEEARAGHEVSGMRTVLIVSTLGAVVLLALIAAANGAA